MEDINANVYGFLGNFKSYENVGYIVEDADYSEASSERSITRHVHWYRGNNGKQGPFISFMSEFALAMYIMHQLKPMKLNIISYVPATLLAIIDRETICENSETIELKSNEVLNRILSAFKEKINDAVKKLEEKHEKCEDLRFSIEFHKKIKDMVEDALSKTRDKERNLYGESTGNLGKTELTLRFILTPLSLTQTVRCNGNDVRVVTFRHANSSSTLSYVSALLMFSDLYQSLLREDKKVILAVDLTHGLNYAPSSLQVGLYEYFTPWLSAWVNSRFYNSGSEVQLKIFNSDPVTKPSLDFCEGYAYKIHLAAQIRPGNLLMSGQDYLSKTIQELEHGKLNNLVRKLLANRREETKLELNRDDINYLELALASGAIGLPFETLYYTKIGWNIVASIIGRYEEMHKKIIDLLPNKIKMVKKPEYRNNMKDKRVIVNIDYLHEYYKDRSASDIRNILLIYTSASILQEVLKLLEKCLDVSVGKDNEGHPKGTIKVRWSNSAERTLELCEDSFRWLSKTSKFIALNELVNDNIKINPDEEKCKTFFYNDKDGTINRRNFIAHAGISRGAVIKLTYCLDKSFRKSLLSEIDLKDTESLQQVIKSLARPERSY